MCEFQEISWDRIFISLNTSLSKLNYYFQNGKNKHLIKNIFKQIYYTCVTSTIFLAAVL